MALNVNPTFQDVFYRYKMPKLVAKVEGKGNGIKTVIVNMSDIAKAIYRKPSYPTKYFGFELGAQIKLDEVNDRYIVNGCHDAGKLQELLYGFIKKFVLCHNCGNPETTIMTKKSGALFCHCRACGNTEQVDPTHRLTQFILKNPPESEAEGAHVERTNITETDNDLLEGSKNWVDNSPEEDILSETIIETLSIEDKKLLNEKRKAMDFREFVESLFNKLEIISHRQAIEKKLNELSLGPSFVIIIMEVIFCNRDTVLEDVQQYKTVFQHFTRRGSNKNKVQEFCLLGMERLIESLNIIEKSCHFLNELYVNDIVEEDAILKWYGKGPSSTNVSLAVSKNILDRCAKMIEWLQEADEESEGED